MVRALTSRVSTQFVAMIIVGTKLYQRLHHDLLHSGLDSRTDFGSSRRDLSFLPPALPVGKKWLGVYHEDDLLLPNNTTTFFSQPSSPSPSSPPWAFFYNVYMPHDADTGISVADIVQEQLRYVGLSYAATSTNDSSLTVFYNTIGRPVSRTFMDDACRKGNPTMDCVHMEHFDEAYEEKTLDKLHQYCQKHQDHRVGYIHNKGSYNSRNTKNQWWRRHMTLAVTDRMCMDPPDDYCDICGLNFYVLPWMHFSGNFFTARCSYINKLLPVDEFRQKMSDLAAKTTEYEQQGRFLFHIFRNQKTYMGLDRYASEAWPGSHPSVVACDLSVERKVDFWKQERAEVHSFWNFSLAPRPTDGSGKYLHTRRTLRNKDLYRLREYWLLAGNLFKWINLYKEIPPKTSWVWNFFPDGDTWYNGYTLYGDHVVEALLDPFAMADGNLSLPIYQNVTKHHHDQEEYKKQRDRQRSRRQRRRGTENVLQ